VRSTSATATILLSLACIAFAAVVTDPYMIPTPDNPVHQAEVEYWADFYRNFLPEDEEAMEPVSDFLYPIIDNIDHVIVAGSPDYTPQKYRSVGMVVAQTYWRSMIRYALSILEVLIITAIHSLTSL
jgi:hypothetical protein